MALRLVDDPAPLTVTDVPAEPAALGPLRRRLMAWAASAGLPPDLVDDVALATYEAMANVADHAYGSGVDRGFHLQAARTAEGRVVVTVIDRGNWRPPAAATGGLRGRGLRLMRELAHDIELHHDERGTTVQMSWHPQS